MSQNNGEKSFLTIRVSPEFKAWYRAKLVEEYGTTYGYIADIIERSVENYFHDITKKGSKANQQHHHLLRAKKTSKRRDVQLKLQRIVAELREFNEVSSKRLSVIINNNCSQNGKNADVRTRETYIGFLITGAYGLSLVPGSKGNPDAGMIFKVVKVQKGLEESYDGQEKV